MNKRERFNVLGKVKPQTWYLFCLVESMCPSAEAITSKKELARNLNISVPTLTKYIATWSTLGLIKEVPGGFVIAQLDGQESQVDQSSGERKFKKAKDIIDLFCRAYFEEYGETYSVSNWAMAQKQLKKLMAFTDQQIEGGIIAAIKLYPTKWISAAYPRPTLGALASWLFQQALPYADLSAAAGVAQSNSAKDVVVDLVKEGWA